MKLTRKPDRGVSDRSALNHFLDSQLAGTLSTVADGRPWVVPLLYARDGDRILLHGSTGAGALQAAAAGAPVVFSVFCLDGLRVSFNGFHSGANYRSAVVEGTCRRLDADERWAALELLTDRLIRGRTAEVVAMTPKEVAGTIALELPITADGWLLKVRGGAVKADPEAAGVWMGYLPLPVVAGDPIPAIGQDPDLPVPPSVRATVRAHRPR